MDINQLMRQAQSMQKKMSELQQEMANNSYEGKAGGGLVSLIMSGDGKMNKVNIDISLLQESEKEMLEDLLVAAHNDAKNKAEADSKARMGANFGSLGPLAQGLKF